MIQVQAYLAAEAPKLEEMNRGSWDIQRCKLLLVGLD
jgi:hypothetical protein